MEKSIFIPNIEQKHLSKLLASSEFNNISETKVAETNDNNNHQNNNQNNNQMQNMYLSIYKTLSIQSQIDDHEFALNIDKLSRDEQFIYTMQRWSYQIYEVEKNLQFLVREQDNIPPPKQSQFELLRLPIGSYIRSCRSNHYYLNLGVEAKTLQGCIYIGVQYPDNGEFINMIVNEMMQAEPDQHGQKHPNFAKLIAMYSSKPSVAIKYYDKNSCDLGVTLSGIPVKEKPNLEIKILKLIYKTAQENEKLNRPLLPWLQLPHKNIIRLIEHWEDREKNALFMITEYANCGELLLFIGLYHPIIYKEKLNMMQRIDQIQSNHLRERSIINYQMGLNISKDGSNAYIEFIRFLFQQMVQSIFTLHCQGIAHLDISCENFVLHFDENGQFLVKLIDFGRATKVQMKHDDVNNLNNQNEDEDEYEYEYQKYDFNVSTFPGKCRYMSPESALFLKYKKSTPYDASKEDIFSLGIVLYCMLTCSLPYDKPFYIEPDEMNPNYGYLNGQREEKYKINLQTMRSKYIQMDESELDENFENLMKYGPLSLIQRNCFADFFSHDSLDLLIKIFKPNKERISLSELIKHPFVTTPPNPTLLMQIIQHVVQFKAVEYKHEAKEIEFATQQINSLHTNRLHIQCKSIINMRQKQQLYQQQMQQMQHLQHLQSLPSISSSISSSAESPMIEPVLLPPVIITPDEQKNNDQYIIPSIPSIPFDPEASYLNIDIDPCSYSPSPPPVVDYTCSPSPEMYFSPSPSPEMSPASFDDDDVDHVHARHRNDNDDDEDDDDYDSDDSDDDDPRSHRHRNDDVVNDLLYKHFSQIPKH